MRPRPHNRVLDNCRVVNVPDYHSPPGAMFGAFILHSLMDGKTLLKVMSSGSQPKLTDWEHVSVSTDTRTPVWEEMAYVKNIFWGEDEAVMQLHPPQSQYVNHHPYCLHLWRPFTLMIPLPPSSLVGPINSFASRK